MANDRPEAARHQYATLIEPGSVVGGYRIAAILADGPSGAVYEGQIIASGRRVALRQLTPAIAQNPDAIIDAVEISGKLSHRNIVVAEGVERHDGQSYLVMEFAGSRTAASEGRMSWRVATRMIRDAARGLAAAHNAGMAHRDLKPAHVVIGNDGVVKIADFGLAPTDLPLGGAPDFRSPEQLQGELGDAHSDLYSLGAVFFALLTGRPPFAGRTPADVIDGHLHQSPSTVRVGAASIPLRCDSIIHRAMAKSPAERYRSADAMIVDLESLLATDDSFQPIPLPRLPSRKRRWLSETPAVLGVLLCLAGLVVGAWQVLVPTVEKEKTKSTKPGIEAPPVLKMTNSIGMNFAQAPAGRFVMGDPLIADARQHLAQISKPFWIGVHEVNQAQYKRMIGDNPSHFQNGRSTDDERPVENVTWGEAVEFCERLSARPEEKAAGRVYRLPTEAEWEYACRAGTKTPFWLGGKLSPTQANSQMAGLLATSPVGTYEANPLGLYDVVGNVWEWCYDWYGADYYGISTLIDPQGPPNGTHRVIRGGGWDSPPDECRSAFRAEAIAPNRSLTEIELRNMPPAHRSPNLGFRVVCVESVK